MLSFPNISPLLAISAGQIVGAASAALVLYNIVSAIYNVYFHPLSKIPGPKVTAISRLPLIYSIITGNAWQFTGKLHAQYGPVVRTAPDEIATTFSSAWKDIYMSKPLMPKDPFSQTPPMNGAESLFTAAGETHQRIRKTLINAFSDRALKDQSAIISSYANLLITRLRREVGKDPKEEVDVAKYYGYTALDIIADLTYGESFFGLEGDNEHSWILGFFLGAKFGSVRNSLSRFNPIDKIFGWIFLRLTAKNRARSWRIATGKISRRLAMGDLGPSRSDFITPIVGRLDETKQKGITRKELNTNGLAFVIAGCQLPTVALATSTYLLIRYPETLKQLTKEVRESFESETDITVSSTTNLPYLAAVIDETLRIHHPTPINLPRVVSPEGRMIGGYWITGGNIIGVNLQNIQNDPNNWVEPRNFCPERFLSKEDSRYQKRFAKEDKQAFQPFSVGGRNCMGGKLFLAEARLILSKIVWNFDLDLVDPNDWSWMDQKAYLVFEPKALMVKLKEKPSA